MMTKNIVVKKGMSRILTKKDKNKKGPSYDKNEVNLYKMHTICLCFNKRHIVSHATVTWNRS